MRRLVFLVLPVVLVLAYSAYWSGSLFNSRSSELPQHVNLLWIEEVNTHLFAPDAASAQAVDPITLLVDQRSLNVSRLDHRQSGRGGPHVLAVYRLYDHDYLTAAGVQLLASNRLPQRLDTLSYPAHRHQRLLPGDLVVEEIREDGSIVMTVGSETVRIEPGQVWAEGRVEGRLHGLAMQGDPELVRTSREAIEAALDDGRAVTVLRLRHLESWSLTVGRDAS